MNILEQFAKTTLNIENLNFAKILGKCFVRKTTHSAEKPKEDPINSQNAFFKPGLFKKWKEYPLTR